LGQEIFYDGLTGVAFQASIHVGPMFTMRLHHMAADKVSVRTDGLTYLNTRQPATGLVRLEYEPLLALGLSNQWLNNSDACFVAICNRTGSIAIYNEEENLFLSPELDEPFHWSTALQISNYSASQIQTVSRYGYDFSIIKVPYAFKLLMQELQTMNVQVRVITEGNVDQLVHKTNASLEKVGKTVDQLLQSSYNKLQKKTSSTNTTTKTTPTLKMKSLTVTTNPNNANEDLAHMANRIATLSTALSAAASNIHDPTKLNKELEHIKQTLEKTVVKDEDEALKSQSVELQVKKDEKEPEKVLTMAEKASGQATPEPGSLMAVPEPEKTVLDKDEDGEEKDSTKSIVSFSSDTKGSSSSNKSSGTTKRVITLS
jgi:DNA-directed RNA polymerase II subunit RPB2